MVSLRYLACPDCGTVYSVPDERSACRRCGGTDLEPLPPDPAAAAYFADAIRDDGGS